MNTSLRDALRRRFSPDERLGLRLTLGLLGVGVFVVPFLLLWLLVEDSWRPLAELDLNAARALNNAVWRHPNVVDALKVVSLVFNPNIFRLVAVAVAVWLLARRHLRLAAFVIVAVTGGSALDGLAKTLAHRHRPLLDHPVAAAPGYSFPSGHALGSLVGVAVLLLVFLPMLPKRGRSAAWFVAITAVVAVGFSRIALGVHFVSDVVGGWVLGGAWMLVCTAAFAIWRRETGRRVELAKGLEPEVASKL
jgi:membrane-associated phospholipid phosphatase